MGHLSLIANHAWAEIADQVATLGLTPAEVVEGRRIARERNYPIGEALTIVARVRDAMAGNPPMNDYFDRHGIDDPVERYRLLAAYTTGALEGVRFPCCPQE